jgi:hypothetical protein
MPKFMVLGLCGGSEAAFAEGLATGDILEVLDPDTGRPRYQVSSCVETDTASRAKKMKASNPNAQAVLDRLHLGYDFAATGRKAVPPLPGQPAQSSQQAPPLMLEDASRETKIKLRLEQAKVGADGQIWKAHKIAHGLLAEVAPSSSHRAILAQLQAAIVECEAVHAELASAGLKWVTTKMSQQDAAAAVEQLETAKNALENLAEWAKAGGGVKLNA